MSAAITEAVGLWLDESLQKGGEPCRWTARTLAGSLVAGGRGWAGSASASPR